jgi:hypothetical protein
MGTGVFEPVHIGRQLRYYTQPLVRGYIGWGDGLAAGINVYKQRLNLNLEFNGY